MLKPGHHYLTKYIMQNINDSVSGGSTGGGKRGLIDEKTGVVSESLNVQSCNVQSCNFSAAFAVSKRCRLEVCNDVIGNTDARRGAVPGELCLSTEQSHSRY